MPRAVPWPLIAGISAARHAALLTTCGSRLPGGLVVARAYRSLAVLGGLDVLEAGQVDCACLFAERARPTMKSSPAGPQSSSRRNAPEAASVDAAHDLADEMSVEERRLPVRRPRRPCGLLRGEERAQTVPVVEGGGVGGCVDRDDAGLVREDVPDRCRRSEFRPVALHGRVEVDEAAVDEQQRAHRGKRLRHRVRLHDAVLHPEARTVSSRSAAPEIDDPSTVVPRGNRSAGAALLAEHRREHVAHRLESRRDRTMRARALVDVHRRVRKPLWTPLPRVRARRRPRAHG